MKSQERSVLKKLNVLILQSALGFSVDHNYHTMELKMNIPQREILERLIQLLG